MWRARAWCVIAHIGMRYQDVGTDHVPAKAVLPRSGPGGPLLVAKKGPPGLKWAAKSGPTLPKVVHRPDQSL